MDMHMDTAQIYMHTCILSCVHSNVNTSIHTYTYTHARTHARTHTYTHTHIHIHTDRQTDTHTHTHRHTQEAEASANAAFPEGNERKNKTKKKRRDTDGPQDQAPQTGTRRGVVVNGMFVKAVTAVEGELAALTPEGRTGGKGGGEEAGPGEGSEWVHLPAGVEGGCRV